MSLLQRLRRLAGRNRVTIEETTTGYEDYAQDDLPGERTVVLSTGSGEMFFAVDDQRGVVYVPEAYDDETFPVGPSDSTALVDALAQNTDYDVEFKRVMQR